MNGKDLTQGSILGNIMTFSLPITSSPRYSVDWATLRVRCILWRWLAWSTSFWIISSSDFWDWAQWVQPLVPPVANIMLDMRGGILVDEENE